MGAGAPWLMPVRSQVGSSERSYLRKVNVVSLVVEQSLRKLNIKQRVCAGKRCLLCPGLPVKAVALGLGFWVLRRAGFLSDPPWEVITHQAHLLGPRNGPIPRRKSQIPVLGRSLCWAGQRLLKFQRPSLADPLPRKG